MKTIAELVEEARQRRYEQRDDVRCIVCGAPGVEPELQTDGWHYRIDHLPYCRVGKQYALAAGPKPAGHEPLPINDRNVSKSKWGAA